MATLKLLENGSWRLTYSDSSGQHRPIIGNKSWMSRREAEAKLRDVEYQLAVGRGQAAPQIPTYSEFAEEYLEWHVMEFPSSAARVAQLTKQHLIPWFGETAIDLLSTKQVDDYKHARSRAGAAVGTITKELRTLKAQLNRSVEWGVLAKNPISSSKPPKQLKSSPPPFYTGAQLEKLYSTSPFHGPIWKLLANTGLRRAEAMALTWTDVSAKSILVKSSMQQRTKSAKYRTIPKSPGAAEALKYIKSKYRTTDFVLPRTTYVSLSRAFRKCARRAKLNGSLHWLRHTFCSHLAMQGKSASVIKELAGHSTIRMSEQYMHLSKNHLDESVSGLEL